MPFLDFRVESRSGWGINYNAATGTKPAISDEKLQLGAILRIADSLESIQASLKSLASAQASLKSLASAQASLKSLASALQPAPPKPTAEELKARRIAEARDKLQAEWEKTHPPEVAEEAAKDRDPQNWEDWLCLGLPYAVIRGARKRGVRTVAGIAALTEAEVLAFHGVGPAMLRKAREALLSYGLKFAPEAAQ